MKNLFKIVWPKPVGEKAKYKILAQKLLDSIQNNKWDAIEYQYSWMFTSDSFNGNIQLHKRTNVIFLNGEILAYLPLFTDMKITSHLKNLARECRRQNDLESLKWEAKKIEEALT